MPPIIVIGRIEDNRLAYGLLKSLKELHFFYLMLG